jgi:hypothetical protein
VATAGKLADDKVQKDISKKDVDHQIADTQILKNLGKYLLLNDSPDFRFRVVLSLGLLVGAKVNATCFKTAIHVDMYMAKYFTANFVVYKPFLFLLCALKIANHDIPTIPFELPCVCVFFLEMKAAIKLLAIGSRSKKIVLFFYFAWNAVRMYFHDTFCKWRPQLPFPFVEKGFFGLADVISVIEIIHAQVVYR